MSGHLRVLPGVVERHVRALERLRARHDVELFVHTWSVVDSGDPSWWRAASHGERKSSPMLGSYEAESLDLLKAAAVTVEEQPQASKEHELVPGSLGLRADEVAARNLAYMWYGISKAYELLERHEINIDAKFDVVVRTRPDLLWNLVAELDEYAREEVARFPRRYAATQQPSDVAFIVPRDTSDAVFHIYHSIPRLRTIYRDEFGYPSITAEYFLGFCLNDIGLNWRTMTYDLAIVRERGPAHWVAQSDAFFAYICGSSVRSTGDGRLYSDNPQSSDERFITEVSFNTRPESRADYEIAYAGPGLLSTMVDAPHVAVKSCLELAVASSSRLSRVYLSAVSLCACRSILRMRNVRQLALVIIHVIVRSNSALRLTASMIEYLLDKRRRHRKVDATFSRQPHSHYMNALVKRIATSYHRARSKEQQLEIQPKSEVTFRHRE